MIRRLICHLTGGHEYDAFPVRGHFLPRWVCIKCSSETIHPIERG